LVCLGALLGLAGSVPFYLFAPALLAVVCFAVVLLFGLLTLGGWHRSHALRTAILIFAFLGGMSSLWVLWFLGSPFAVGDLAVLLGTAGVVGMTVSLIGAGLGRMSEAEVAGAKLIDINRLGALLICAGGAIGLVGSRVGFLGIFVFFTACCFALVLLFGVALLRTKPEGRLFAAATLYFALAGSGLSIVFYIPFLLWYGGGSVAWILLQPLATVIAGAGAVIRLIRSRG